MANSDAEIAAVYRRRIVAAAEALFAQEGFARVGVNDIAREADLSKRTLYSYYPSKEAIYLAIVLQGFADLRDVVARVLALELEFDEATEALVVAVFEGWEAHRCRMESALRFSPPAAPAGEDPAGDTGTATAVAAIFAAGYEVEALVAEFIARGQAAGRVRPDIDPRVTGLVLWAALSSLMTLSQDKAAYLEGEFALTPGEFCRQGVHLLLAGIGVGHD